MQIELSQDYIEANARQVFDRGTKIMDEGLRYCSINNLKTQRLYMLLKDFKSVRGAKLTLEEWMNIRKDPEARRRFEAGELTFRKAVKLAMCNQGYVPRELPYDQMIKKSSEMFRSGINLSRRSGECLDDCRYRFNIEATLYYIGSEN